MPNKNANGEEFNYEGVETQREILMGLFDKFGEIFKEANDLINNNFDKTPDSAMLGKRAAALLELWNENTATYSDFSENFDVWSKVMIVASNNLKNYEEEFKKARTTGASMSGVKQNGADIIDKYNEDISKKTKETYSSDTGAKALDTSKYDDSYFIQRGDKCNVYGQNVTFFGRDGSYNYYVDSEGMIFYDDGSKLRSLEVSESMFNINYLKDENGWYGGVSTNLNDATEKGLPDVSTIEATNVSFDEYGASELVNYGTPLEEKIIIPSNDASFQESVSNPIENQVIQIKNKKLTYDWVGSSFKNSDTSTTLVYDERAGKYYKLEEDGTYIRNQYGYTPGELAEMTIE